MSKRKLDEAEESDQSIAKLVKQTLAEDKEFNRDYSNGDESQLPTFLNGDKIDLEQDNLQDLLSNDFENGSESHSLEDLAPAKRISKRSVKRNIKLKREKSRTLGVAADSQDVTDEDPSSKSKRRTWERWSKEDTYIFFEGLNEFGKDFDKLQAHFKAKYRNKRGFPENYIKNKDQIRHFYYRTWHKISGYINFNKDLKNNTKELSGLINYGELWKKTGTGTVDDKFGAKLDDMVQKGNATVKIKGKTLRIKTPVCRALKKLTNKEVEFLKPKNKSKLPSKVILELRPRTTSDWCRVQKIAQNPHIRVCLGVQRKLVSVIKCLERKWRSQDDKTKLSLASNQQSESPDSSDSKQMESSGYLVLLPPRGVTVKPKERCCAKLEVDKLKRPKIKIKLSGFDTCADNASREKDNCDILDDTESKFEEILSMQRKRVEPENGIDENSNDAEDPSNSPKQDGESPKNDDIVDNIEEEDNDYLDESDQECSRSPIQNDDTIENNDELKYDDCLECDVKDDEDENRVDNVDILDDLKDDDEDVKTELEEDCKPDTSCFNPEEGWSRGSVGSITIGDLYSMISGGEAGVARLRLDYCWRQVKAEPLTDVLSRLVKLATSSLVKRGRNNSTSSGGGSPSVRQQTQLVFSSPVPSSAAAKTQGRGLANGGTVSPVGRGLGAVGGAAKQIVLPGPGAAGDTERAASPLAVPLQLDQAEHEFRKPLLPPAPAQPGQGAMSLAFKEQIGQYLPKWSNRPGRQRRSRVKQVVGRHLLHPNIQPRAAPAPAPAPGTQPILTILAQQPSTIVQVVPVQTVDTAAITLAAPLAPGTDLGPLMEEPQENGQGQEISTNGTAATSHESPPQISIPSPSRRSPSPTPSFSSFMDMSFDSCGQRTPTKSDQFLNIYHDNENSLLQTPPRPAPSPSPGFSQDLSMSSWSLNFDSPMKNLSLPLPFNEDSQSSTISTVSEVS